MNDVSRGEWPFTATAAVVFFCSLILFLFLYFYFLWLGKTRPTFTLDAHLLLFLYFLFFLFVLRLLLSSSSAAASSTLTRPKIKFIKTKKEEETIFFCETIPASDRPRPTHKQKKRRKKLSKINKKSQRGIPSLSSHGVREEERIPSILCQSTRNHAEPHQTEWKLSKNPVT